MTVSRSETIKTIGSETDNSAFLNTVCYYLAFVILGLAVASVGPTLDGLARHTGSGLGTIGVLFITGSIGYLIGTLLGGRLYDRVSGNLLNGIVLATISLMLLLTPVLTSLWLLSTITLIMGVAEGMIDVGGNTLLVWLYRERVGPFMNGLHFCFGVGAFLSPIIIAQTLTWSGDINWGYWVLAALVVPVAVLISFQKSPQPPQHSSSAKVVALDYRLIALIALFFFLYVGAELGFGGWIYSYAIKMRLGDEATAAYLTSAFWGALTIGRLLAIPIGIRVAPAKILITDLIGCILSVLIIVLWPHSNPALWIGTLGIGVSMASIYPTMIALAERKMAITGEVTGYFFAGGSLGSMSFPWLIGKLFDQIGPKTMMITIFLDLIATTIVFIVLILYRRK